MKTADGTRIVSNRASDSILGKILLRRRISLFTQDFSLFVPFLVPSFGFELLGVPGGQTHRNSQIIFQLTAIGFCSEKSAFLYILIKKEIKKEEALVNTIKRSRKNYSKFEKNKTATRENPNSKKFQKIENLRIRKFKNQEIVPRRTK